MGRRASEYAAELFKSDNYTDYLLFHGLSVESAEALAEMWHKRIREELGIAEADAPELAKLFHQGYQGSRYSFGYRHAQTSKTKPNFSSFCSPSALMSN
jgi:5-methyltetrahydrofolate--homocysteine methyltransferase